MQKYVCNSNVQVGHGHCIITPEELKRQYPLDIKARDYIFSSRRIISNIIHGCESRFLVVCGPCSIHDVNSAIDYAKRLKFLFDELGDQLYIVMRVYLEKPRTTIGWKGLINDPHMDESYDVESGLKIARSLLLNLIHIGLPLATEVLDPNISQYLSECFSWSAIGARTTESQIHREIASGLSMPVGFKNTTDGSIELPINAMRAASIAHYFIGINQSGRVALLHTSGNVNGHIILRGGKYPNYYPKNILDCEQKISQFNLPQAILIDCSHGNSNKEYHRQMQVGESVISQIQSGNHSIVGLMLESHIYSGSQSLKLPIHEMNYGVSVTDPCIDWATTENFLRYLYSELKPVLFSRVRKM